MISKSLAFVIAIILSIITVGADALIKQASLKAAFSGWRLLLIGAVIYGLTAVGWFLVMREIKLSTLGVVYGTSCIICLVLLSVFFFKESINLMELFGIGLGIASLMILYRFS